MAIPHNVFKWKLRRLIDPLLNRLIRADVYMVVEPWATESDAVNIKKHLKIKIRITTNHKGIRNSIVHFMSFHTYITGKGTNHPHPGNKVIVTCYHVDSKIEKRIKEEI